MYINLKQFYNYTRCPRYAALEKRLENNDKTSAKLEESLEGLTKHEKAEKRKAFLDELFETLNNTGGDDEETEDSETRVSEQLTLYPLLQYQYDHINQLIDIRIANHFNIKQPLSSNNNQNKYVELIENGHHFYAFIDNFIEEDVSIHIIDGQTTTTRKFFDVGYKKDKEFNSIFYEDSQGIYRLKNEIGIPVEQDQYEKQYLKLFNQFDEVGKYVYELAYKRYIFEKNNGSNKTANYYLAVLNHNYVYDGKRDEEGKPFYEANEIISLIDLSIVTESLQSKIEEDIKRVLHYLNQLKEEPTDLGYFCQKGKPGNECPMMQICLADKNVPETNSLFAYRNLQYPFNEPVSNNEKKPHSIYELINGGITNALDINQDWLSDVQKMQYNVIKSKKPYVDLVRLKAGISTLKYPLYHLDFESFSSPLPRYKGEKPYQPSLFQFSLHVEHENKEPDKNQNFYYLANNQDDHRERLVQKLIQSIPMDGGSVIVYSRGFESARISELITLFPQYENQLRNIQSRIFDLLYLIRGNAKFYQSLGFSKNESSLPIYYDERFQRSFSIKKVLPVFVPSLDYKNLEEVQNGQQAQVAYFLMTNMPEDERNKTYNNLLEYCKQDTWAMVEILKHLRKL